MAGFAGRVARESFRADLSAMRTASAARRGLVVCATLITTYIVFGPVIAASTATSALLVGLLDKGRSPRATWQLMAAGTVFMAVATIASGLLAGSFVAMLGLMAALAFCAGFSYAIDPRLPQLFVFSALLVAGHLVAPMELDVSLVAATLTVIAGGLQTGLAWISAPVVGDLPERRVVAGALAAVGRLADTVARTPRQGATEALVASSALAEADSLIAKTDLATSHRRRYVELLADANTIRLEARGFAARRRLGIATAGDSSTEAAFAEAAKQLNEAATTLSAWMPPHPLRRDNHQPPIYDSLATATQPESSGESETVTQTALQVRAALSDLPSHLNDVMMTPASRSRRHPEVSVRQRLEAAAHWRSRPVFQGARMALAAVVGMTVAELLHLPHGSWVAVTAIMLLRPDTGPTVPRVAMRAVGTVVAVAAVTGIAALTGSHSAVLIAVICVLSILMYAVIAVSYSAQVTALTTVVILLLSLAGSDPGELAATRLLDVLVGCVLAIVIAMLIPIWSRSKVPADIAEYAEALADWVQSVAAMCASGSLGSNAQFEVASATARDRAKVARQCRQVAKASVTTSFLEPPSRSFSPGAHGIVLSWLTRCSESAVAAEALLRHDPTGNNGEAHVARASQNLRHAAAWLRQGSGDGLAAEDLPFNVDSHLPLPDETAALPPISAASRAQQINDLLARADHASGYCVQSVVRIYRDQTLDKPEAS